jgi:hypothetical protein
MNSGHRTPRRPCDHLRVALYKSGLGLRSRRQVLLFAVIRTELHAVRSKQYAVLKATIS